MKSFLRTLLITGVPYGLMMGIFFGVTRNGIIAGMLWGATSGLIFGLIMASIIRIQENRALGSPPVLTDDEILREGRASHTTGRRGQAGRLYLTNQQILFEAFPPNKPAYRVGVPIHEVYELKRQKRIGIFPVFLNVHLKDGRRERFVTDDVDDWIEDISNARRKYIDTGRPEESRLFA